MKSFVRPFQIQRAISFSMKLIKTFITKLSSFSAAMLLPRLLVAQTYTVDHLTFGGGASTSTNGNLVVSVTIGQPVAAAGSGSGQYDFAGGFWTLFGFPTSEGTPTNYDYGVSFCSNQVTGSVRFKQQQPRNPQPA